MIAGIMISHFDLPSIGSLLNLVEINPLESNLNASTLII
jgi:hypothetical protein